MAKLLYGGGLRLMECLRLRVKDLDPAQRQIIVRDGKGMEDRVTMLPESLIIPLQEHLAHVKRLHAQMSPRGWPGLFTVCAGTMYSHAGRGGSGTSFSFLASVERPTHRIIRRHHASESALQKAVSQAGRSVGLNKRSVAIPSATFCHASAATGLRHQDGPATPRAQRCENHHGVYAGAEPGRAGRAQPPRLALLGTAPMHCAVGV